jgi:hypothetical protein
MGRAYSTYIITTYVQRVETRCYKMFEPMALTKRDLITDQT